ncbi:MAG: hypothetical protein E6J73_07935 [Deltaproteobacteria bacterium]|nr:MAG: hypothetical protein E6J73_07935 [Deltaproteobacteria bacterium]
MSEPHGKDHPRHALGLGVGESRVRAGQRNYGLPLLRRTHGALRKHYGLNDKAIQFFTVHAVADQEHTAMASEIIAKHADNERQQELVRDAARHMVRYKIAKFEGIYNAYA